MIKTDVLIVGGCAAGIVAATTGKSNNPDKKFLVVRKESKVLVPCGIPYIFGSLESSDKNVIPAEALFEKMGIDLLIGEITSIDKENKTCQMADGDIIGYDKLVLATGSTPLVPQWLKGRDLENVFVVPKDKVYLDATLEKLSSCKKVVVVGAGFIGVEISDELKKKGKDVVLVELMDHILGMAFDQDISIKAQNELERRGVAVKLGAGIKEIQGDGKVSKVVLGDGEVIDADAVILSMGYRPNIDLAKTADMRVSKLGFFAVDEYMRTDEPDIFAVGDCAEKRDCITHKDSPVMLASVACAEARVAGMNLYKLSTLKTIHGTIAIFCTVVGNMAFGAAGVTEKIAQKEGFDIIVGEFEGMDKHPGSLEGTSKQLVKLIVARESGVVLGGEIIGGQSIGELVNVLGVAIQNGMTVNSLLTLQIGTHPLLTAAPTAYPLIKAAEVSLRKL